MVSFPIFYDSNKLSSVDAPKACFGHKYGLMKMKVVEAPLLRKQIACSRAFIIRNCDSDEKHRLFKR